MVDCLILPSQENSCKIWIHPLIPTRTRTQFGALNMIPFPKTFLKFDEPLQDFQTGKIRRDFEIFEITLENGNMEILPFQSCTTLKVHLIFFFFLKH